jgi:hypothetical protein
VAAQPLLHALPTGRLFDDAGPRQGRKTAKLTLLISAGNPFT